MQYNEKTQEYKSGAQEHLLDWAYQATQVLSWGLLVILFASEIFDFLSKRFEYFTKQNMTEFLLISVTTAFFAVQYNEKTQEYKSGAQEHLLGWAFFLGWTNITIFLAPRFDNLGRAIHLSWHAMANVAWYMLVNIPALIAFSLAFHCFLRQNPGFKESYTSLIKTLTMMIGEYDYEANFLEDNTNHGSAQVFCTYIFTANSAFLLFYHILSIAKV